MALLAPGIAHASGNDDDHRGTPTLSAPIAEGLAGPLQLAVDDGVIYVAQDFAGILTRIGGDGRADIAANPGGEIAGVAVRDHTVLYTTTNPDASGNTTAAALYKLRRGSSAVVADVLAWENNPNPDHASTYGFESITPECAAQWPVDVAGPTSYTGIIDSHPYAVAVNNSKTYIADAAGNAILEVGPHGVRRTVAVLPPQPTVLSAEAVAANQLPSCVTGLTYDFEPVPTDVEVGHDGMLYVTTLPGGPEDPSLGARGSVYRINPRTGVAVQIATGLAGAANLAIGQNIEIFVSELFANRVSRIVNGAPQTVVDVPNPAALEYADGMLYVGYDVFANGTVATISIGHENDD